MKFEFSGRIFAKYSNIMFHEYPPSESRVVHADGRTGMTKVIVPLRNFAKTRRMPVERLLTCDKPFRSVLL